MGRSRRKGNPERRRENANIRAEIRSQRTPKQQIERLDFLLGKGVGAVKERARLAKQINEKNS